MEIQLQELIDRIRKDGVDAAEVQAASILEDARAQAERIISDAQAEADRITANAKAENERAVKSGEDAIRQAGRNLLISFRESVARELKAVTESNVNAVCSSDELRRLIAEAVVCWAGKPDAEDISVILNENDLKKLESGLLDELKKKMIKGVTLKVSDSFDGGFRIAANDSGVYYDYSADAVTDMLSAYLSPAVAALMKEAE